MAYKLELQGRYVDADYSMNSDITSAAFLNKVGKKTPLFVRFSTVAGERGSADSVRDSRGFAFKLYTEEGNLDWLFFSTVRGYERKKGDSY